MLLDSTATYRQNYGSGSSWHIPEFYNIANEVCDRHAEGDNGIALIHDRLEGEPVTYRFRDIQRLAKPHGERPRRRGARCGDRVMILLGQTRSRAVAHVACWKAALSRCRLPSCSAWKPSPIG